MIILTVLKVSISIYFLHFSDVFINLNYLMKAKKFLLKSCSFPVESKIYFNFTASFSLFATTGTSLSSNLQSGSKAKFILDPDDPASTNINTSPNN